MARAKFEPATSRLWLSVITTKLPSIVIETNHIRPINVNYI